MKISVFGVGYVGIVTGVCLAEKGNEVLCVDIAPEKILLLKNGKSPIYEKDMDKFLSSNIAKGTIDFTLDAQKGVEGQDCIFIAVGTPSASDGSANLEHVWSVAKTIGENLNSYSVIVNKSTAPVGTLDQIRAIISTELKRRGKKVDFDVVSNPEFLKQGDAISDFMNSDRIVIGTDSDKAFEKMHKLYEPFNTKILDMDIHSAELTKYAANAFLAARISFMNEIALLAEKLGADVEKVRLGISTDPRVGQYFLYAGCGYGGSCFPKDVKALCKMAEEHALPSALFNAVETINERQKRILFERVLKYFKGDLKNKTIALWGLAFKPNTDDMRDAPSLTILELLWRAGAIVKAYDPIAINEAKRIYGERPDLIFTSTAHQVLENADALMIVTEWEEFKNPDFALIKNKLKNKVIFDGRNIYDPKTMLELGIEYKCIGRLTNQSLKKS